MKLKIIYFPPFKSLVGYRSEEVDVKSMSITVLDLLRILTEKHPQLKSYILTESDEELRTQMSIVANSDLLKMTDRLEEGKIEEVKILPPIVGGSGG